MRQSKDTISANRDHQTQNSLSEIIVVPFYRDCPWMDAVSLKRNFKLAPSFSFLTIDDIRSIWDICIHSSSCCSMIKRFFSYFLFLNASCHRNAAVAASPKAHGPFAHATKWLNEREENKICRVSTRVPRTTTYVPAISVVCLNNSLTFLAVTTSELEGVHHQIKCCEAAPWNCYLKAIFLPWRFGERRCCPHQSGQTV